MDWSWAGWWQLIRATARSVGPDRTVPTRDPASRPWCARRPWTARRMRLMALIHVRQNDRVETRAIALASGVIRAYFANPQSREGPLSKTDSSFRPDQYAMVAERIELLYSCCPDGPINTELVTRRDGEITFKAWVYRAASETQPPNRLGVRARRRRRRKHGGVSREQGDLHCRTRARKSWVHGEYKEPES